MLCHGVATQRQVYVLLPHQCHGSCTGTERLVLLLPLMQVWADHEYVSDIVNSQLFANETAAAGQRAVIMYNGERLAAAHTSERMPGARPAARHCAEAGGVPV